MKIFPKEIGLLNSIGQMAITYLHKVANAVDKKTLKNKETFTVEFQGLKITGKWRIFGGGNDTLGGIEEIIGWEWYEIIINEE